MRAFYFWQSKVQKMKLKWPMCGSKAKKWPFWLEIALFWTFDPNNSPNYPFLMFYTSFLNFAKRLL